MIISQEIQDRIKERRRVDKKLYYQLSQDPLFRNLTEEERRSIAVKLNMMYGHNFPVYGNYDED